jgi:formylglycine-generating enzyme required for sulfatase activity
VGDNHPIEGISWDDAHAFCAWLSKKEGRIYRLPTDREWSIAVGLGSSESAGATPESLNEKIPNVYPWGTAWPMPKGAGNYWDITAVKEFRPKPAEGAGRRAGFLEGFGNTDGFAGPAPVMSFTPNSLGLYDLGGNAWEICEDTWNPTSNEAVFRGSSWVNGMFSSSCRVNLPKNAPAGGFRLVLETTAP